MNRIKEKKNINKIYQRTPKNTEKYHTLHFKQIEK